MNRILRPVHLLAAVFLLVLSCKPEQTYNEKNRLQYHFSPEKHWMNDPNGLVWFEGEYHLFYQYYPDSTVWGPMHWGHAVSNDLVHWKNLPIALYPDSLGYIFSGSAVIDRNNSSGLQSGDFPPMIAVFTQHSEKRLKEGRTDYQNQSIAYSNDKGRTFKKYDHNPVIKNPGEKDFRDPKVIYIDDLDKWVMVLAAGQKVEFYSSANLLKWQHMSDFGTGLGAHGGVWECPDLFPLAYGDTTKWVLLVSINPGGPNGGSATQYFTGDFDGTEFIPDNSGDTVSWLDYGPDDYAGVTYSGIPPTDGRRIFIGWMNNWAYAQVVPTSGWRSAMTLPRRLFLREINGTTRICSSPVREINSLRTAEHDTRLVPDSSVAILGLNEFMLNFDLKGSGSEEFGLVFSNDINEKLVIGFNKKDNRFYIDRSKCGITNFSPVFADRTYAPRFADGDTLKMHLFLDHGSLEMFADDGAEVMTETFFPDQDLNRVTLFTTGGDIKTVNCTIWDLKSIWH